MIVFRQLWFLLLCVLLDVFAPSRADARLAETRTWVFAPEVAETRLETEPQAVGTHQENGLWNYEHAPGCTQAAERIPGKSLLPGEGAVGTYDDLIKAGSKGDNITPHHIPSANHMARNGVAKGDGIAINMEHPHPGVGGRHRDTFTYGTQADLNLTPRQALGAGISDARRIYMQDGLYSPQIRQQLQELIRQNRAANPGLFAK